jgi:hypothetical protein
VAHKSVFQQPASAASKNKYCILVHQLSFDAAATAHPEQAERVEGGRRGFAQDEHGCINTTLFFRNGIRRQFFSL